MKKLLKILFIFLLFAPSIIFAQQDYCCRGCGEQDPPPPPQQDTIPTDSTGIPSWTSSDPNEIIGTEGYDSLHWVSVNQMLAYTVYFENDPVFATASAQRVEIRLKLHPNMDRNSFSLGSFGFGSFHFEINNRPPFYQQRLDVRDSLDVFVDITAGIDIVTQEAFWVFETIDPATGLPPVGVHTGFLPVNNPELHDGEGFVNFFIKPRAACVTGDTITVEASIVFDINEAIPTNVWKNTIDAVAPHSTLMATVLETEVEISFAAQDDPDGCGVKEIQLYVAINEEPYEQAGVYPIDTVIYYPYIVGNTYRFQTSALDHVRNKEEFKFVPDTILNENLPPTDIRLSNNTFYNYEEQGETVGVFSTVDRINNQNFTYELVSGNGSTHNAMFDIENNKLVINHNFYCLQDNSYSVRVRTTNESELSYEKTFTLSMISIIEPDTTRIAETICQGGIYNFHGVDLTTAGIYYNTQQDIVGCDSVIELTLTVNPVYTTPLTAEICQGDSYNFNGEILMETGVYYDTLQTVHNCDSVIVLTLTVNPVYTTPISAAICQGETYDFYGEILTTADVYEKYFETANGCDSIINLTLTTHPKPVVDLGGDKVLGINESILLTAEEGDYYLWSIGDTTSQITVTRDMFGNDTTTVWVLVTTENYCTGSDTIQIIFTVDITTYNLADYFNLYPNPSTGKFYLEFKEIGKREINIYDLLGRTVYKGYFEGVKLELEIPHTGTYIIDVNNSIRTKVIIKN